MSDMSFNISDLRKNYHLKSLDLKDVAEDPFLQFKLWFQDAQQAQVLETNAMCLATSSLKNEPSCRMVLLKGINSHGFLFFTNHLSRKGRDLNKNPQACATFFWPELERQIIITGNVDLLSRKESQTYFASRPRKSQIGAWASKQSEVIASKDALIKAYENQEKVFTGKEIPMPDYWGGYCLIPKRFEFWQGRPNRLHDRLQYRLEDNRWIIERLFP